MKKIFGYVVIVALALPLLSFAADFRAGNQPSVGKDEQILNDLYMGGGNISSAGNVKGDLVVGGGSIVISGDVGGDVLAGGGNVSLLSNVGDDVRVGGGNVSIEGKVGGDVLVGGGQVSIRGAGVGGDVMIGGGDIRIDAPVAGKVTIGGSSVFINSPIAGDVDIKADIVELGSGAIISGNLTYKANKELVKDSGAIVNGKITFEERREKVIAPLAFVAIFSAFFIWKFFSILACALLFGLAFHRYSIQMVNTAIYRPLMKMGRGVLVMIVLPIVSLLLFVTLVGIPLGILGMIGFVALMIFTCILAPVIVGSFVYRYFSKRELEVSWQSILIGVIICSLLGLIPFIGWLIQALLMFLTLGSIITLKWRILKEWR